MNSKELLERTVAWIAAEEARPNRPEPLTLVSLSFCLNEVGKAHGADAAVIERTRSRLLRLTQAVNAKTHDVFGTKDAKALLSLLADYSAA